MAITDNMPGMSEKRKENHMLELRKKLSNYQEVFYLLFLLPMTGMHSMGINSDDRIYLYVFAVATLFLLLKMAVTRNFDHECVRSIIGCKLPKER